MLLKRVSRFCLQVLAVVVRYNIPLDESESIESIGHAVAEDPALLDEIAFLVCDNSAEALEDPQPGFPILYRHQSKNTGVSGAYNVALAIAEKQGIPWLLLLDQDTRLSGAFLRAMLQHGQRLLSATEVASIAPVVRVGERIVSPKRALFNRDGAYSGEGGIAGGEAFAINSGSLMRVQALRQVGGFSSEFWLDYSDIYVYHQFYRSGFRVWRATDASLQHDMTILDYDRLMPLWRYRNFIEAEGAFNDLYKGFLENAAQTLRLGVRAWRQRYRYTNQEFTKATRSYLWHRLTTGRVERLEQWREWQRLR